ncbi:zinc ribbon domain-containing protein [Acidobacteriota bacterium]
MPLFEYFCKQCGKTFEKLVLRRDQEKEGIECPECGHKKCVKVPSVFSSSACQSTGSFT